MLLKNLIKNPTKNIKIKGLATNSNDVKKNYIFFAIKGKKFNGENFIKQAIKNGAILIVCSKKCNLELTKFNILKVNNVRDYLSKITARFYSHKPNKIFAVTGTNGKTSVAEFFYQILNINNIPVGCIGTLGIKSKKFFFKNDLTTPDTINLHKNLEKFKRRKIDHVILEASSHGLDQKRLDNIDFKAGIFTNLSQDHLDYHKNMKSYFQAKLILFNKLLKKNSYVIADKKIKQFNLLQKISQKRKLKILDINKEIEKMNKFKSHLVGEFQIKNLATAIAAAKLCNISNLQIKKALTKIKNINGRLELIRKFPNKVKVFIDYAHTPEALKEALHSLKITFSSKISLVFGCGGDRDFKKRPLMAKIAKSFCNKIYVTDDNPRNENPYKIRKQICSFLKGSNYFNIENRAKAINQAIVDANPNDIVLVAGKGHEEVQDYGNKIVSLSDKKIIKELYIPKNNFLHEKKNFLLHSTLLNTITKKKKLYQKVNGLAIDSRNVKKGNLFLAIKGKNNDGNQFIPKAIKKGASYIVSSNMIKKRKNLIKVNSPIEFLNKFANLKRRNTNAKIVAITGSAGKTSLKNILYSLIKDQTNAFASARSFNNHFGVPLSLSNLNLAHQIGIFEVGMNKSGEINKLSKMIKPNVAIITNIGEAHIENFRNKVGIANAKSEIIENIEKGGTLILNKDDKFFSLLNKKAKLKKIKVVSFGKTKKSDIKLISLQKYKNFKNVKVKINKKILSFKIKNINIYNVLASIAVLNELSLDYLKAVKNFINFQPSEGRGKTHNINRYQKKFKLIDESYNANPLSVKNAIQNFSEIKKTKFKKYLLLGDMLELGKNSSKYHQELAEVINRSDIDKVFIKGEMSLFTYKNLKKEKRGNIFQCSEDVDFFLKNIITNNDYLMIKGSNATMLSLISEKMIKGI